MANTSNPTAVFIDTSALIALVGPRDQHHSAIHAYFEQSGESIRGVTSNLVLAEFLSFFSRHGDLEAALHFHDTLIQNLDLKVVWIDLALHGKASKLLSKFADQRLSFTDAASFAIMKEQGLAHALTFDEDFRKAGFQIPRERRRGEVLRSGDRR